jgi:hypothetical protein
MWTGYNLFREQEFTDFAAMRSALEEQLGELEPAPSKPKKAGPSASKNGGAQPKAPPPKKQDVDFDDAE